MYYHNSYRSVRENKIKQKAYLNFIQSNTEESREHYRQQRNRAKSVIRNAHKASWNRFISLISGKCAWAYGLTVEKPESIKETLLSWS